jgi:hypothetical protein
MSAARQPAQPGQDGEDARREQARPRDTEFARLYGARWWHLAVLTALLVGTAYVVSRLLGDPALFRIAVWFVGAAVVWDLLLGPLFALADRGLRATAGRGGVRALNHVRVPALLSLLLLLVWAPLVLQRSEPVYRAKSGLLQDPYLDRWLAVTAVLFAASALVWAVGALRRRGQQGQPGQQGEPDQPGQPGQAGPARSRPSG